MSERSNPRLDNFDANKAAAERADFEAKVYGEAGTTDFSEESRNRVAEGDAYERALERIAERDGMSEDEAYDAMNSGNTNGHMNNLHEQALADNAEFDAAADAEAEAFNERMQADPRVRRMQMLATDIASVGSSEFTADNEARLTQALKDKQDKLETLLLEFTDTFDYDGFSPAEREEIADRIIDMTEHTPVQAETAAADENQESEEPAEEAEANEVETEAETSSDSATETEPTEEAEPVKSIDEMIDEANARNDAKAEQMEAEANAARNNTEQAIADRKALGLSEDGLTIEDEPAESVEGVSKDGLTLEDEPETNEEAEPDAESDDDAPSKMRWRDRVRPSGIAANLSARNYERRNREKSDDTKERKYGKAILAVGGLAVAVAGVALLNKYGFDLPNGGGSGGGSGAGDGAREAATSGNGGGNGGNKLNWNDFDSSARTASDGEGWNQTFKEMGIAEKDWGKVLSTAGPKLEKLGEAYFDNTAGEFRISRPGQLSNDALRVIASSSRKNGVEL